MFLLLIFALFCMNYVEADNGAVVQSNVPQQQLPIQLTINNYQNNANNNTNTHNNVNSNTNATTQNVSLANQLKQSVLRFLSFAKKEVPKQQEIALGFFQQNKQMVFLGALGCAYGVLFAYLYILSNFLANNEQWHSWRNELPLADLAVGDTNELAHSLLVAVQQQYFNPHNPVNYMKSVTRFYKDILVEMQKIDRYVQIGNIIRSCQLIYFFPITKKRIKKAAEKRKRLEFMQKLLITYMATQNSFPITKSYQFDLFLKKAIRSRQIATVAQPVT